MSEDIVKELNQLTLNNEKVKKTFRFEQPKFDGIEFYENYKDAEFLKDNKNIFSILAKHNTLKGYYSDLKPNEEFVMEDMFLESGTPLVLKKSALIDESDVDQNDFTLRRLSGLVAVHVCKIQKDFLSIYSEEAETFGVAKPYCRHGTYDTYYYGFKEYLSAVSGSEYFPHCFNYYPFLFALRRFQLNMISKDALIEIGKIEYPETLEPLAARCSRDYEAETNARRLGFDLNKMLSIAPQELKYYFKPKK